MIKSIIAYVNFYFPTYKTQFYSDNFIKLSLSCLSFSLCKVFYTKTRHRPNYLQTNRSETLPKFKFKYY